MGTTEPILKALVGMEERILQGVDDRFRDLQLDLNGHFDAIHQRLDRLEQEYEMLKAGMTRLEARMAGLEGRMARLEADMSTLKQTVQRLETEIVSVKDAVHRLEARLERDESDRQDLREQVLGFRRRLGELEGRVQAVEGGRPAE